MANGNVVQIALAEVQLLRRPDRPFLAPAPGAERVALPPEHTFHPARPSRLVVGSCESATWRFELPDVAPRHFDLVWDGAELWLQDALRLGRTFVNGRTLNEWRAVAGRALVCFGGVHLLAISRAKRSVNQVPDFTALERARLTDAHQQSRIRLCDTSRITLPPEIRTLLNERDAR